MLKRDYNSYDIERTLLNTGGVMAKTGVNNRKEIPTKSPSSFIIIDNNPHLNEQGSVIG